MTTKRRTILAVWMASFLTYFSSGAASADRAPEIAFGATNTPLDCESLAVFELRESIVSIDESMASATEMPVDRGSCRRQLETTTLGEALAGYVSFLKNDTDGDRIAELSDAERAARDAAENNALKTAARQAKAKLDPLVAYCADIRPEPAPGKPRLCIFGGLSSSDGPAARALFQAMVKESYNEGGTICAEEPLDSRGTINPVFAGFVAEGRPSRSWADIRSELEGDGFQCGEGDEGYEECQRWYLTVIVNVPDPDREMSTEGNYGAHLVVPRILSAYKGQFGNPGRRYSPRLAECARGDASCKPEKGAAKGICIQSEDWHTFSSFALLLNQADW